MKIKKQKPSPAIKILTQIKEDVLSKTHDRQRSTVVDCCDYLIDFLGGE